MEEYLSTLQDLHTKQEEFESDLQQTKRHLFEKIQESYHIMQEQMVALLQEHTHRVLETVAETIADTEGKIKNTLDNTKHIIQDVKLTADTFKRLKLQNEEEDKGDDARKERSSTDENISEVMTCNQDELKETHELQESRETMKRKQKSDDSLGAFDEESLRHKSSIMVESQEGIPSSKILKPNSLNHLIERQGYYSIKSPSDLSKCEICAVCCLDNGRIILADANNKCLKILDNRFGLLKCKCSIWELDQPTGMSHLYEDNFVLSDSGNLKYFSIHSNGNTFVYSTNRISITNWSVVSCHDYIYVLCLNNRQPTYSIWCYGYGGEQLGRAAMKGQFMCFNSNGSKLYLTDGTDVDKSNTVKVFHRSGRRIFMKAFELSSPDLNTPCGVVTDKYDQVYVCGFDSKNILKFDINRNKVHVDVLLAEENALIGQKILGYDKTNHRLIVAGNSDEIKILDLK